LATQTYDMPFIIGKPSFIEKIYSLRFILIDSNMDVSRHILVLDTSILKSINMNRREYKKSLITLFYPTIQIILSII
jgi:hypothetical protein